MRVLIVDDTTFMRITIRRILEMHQIDVVGEAENGIEAVKKYKIILPDVVIMDISMPLMDGIEAVKEIKKFDPDASIIMCSLLGQRANVLEAIKAGAKNFIIKPIKEEKLMRELAKLPLLIFERKKRKPVEVQVAPNDKRADFSDDYLKGIEAGYLEAKREIASNMLKMGISIDLVLSTVELNENEINALKKEYLLD